MSAESVLFTALSTSGSVSAIAASRIYPDAVPQEQMLPSIAWARIETEPTVTIHNNRPVAEFSVFEVSCMTPDRASADALAIASQEALGPAGFWVIGRRAEFDTDNEFRGTVLTMRFFESL